nr:MAG TPA: PD-(D/E)XK nuclease superfamily protein [Caudoviricetes sp.]
MKNTKGLFPEGINTDGMVSVSQLQTFMSCPKKWAYNYIENLTPRIERPFLSVGKLCHKGMETAMRYIWEHDHDFNFKLTDAMNTAILAIDREWAEYISSHCFLEEEMPEQQQILADAQSVFEQAFEEFDPEKYEVVTLYKNGEPIPALELHFLLPCPGSKGLHGYIDAILREKQTGHIWCTDYKFRKSLSPDEDEAFNIQNAVYTKACARMGVTITGTMTWQHINTPAAIPAVLKNGTFSRAKIKTTWRYYAHIVALNGGDPEDYREEMEPKLADIEWFRPTLEYRNPETVLRIWDQAVVPASWAVKRAYKAKNSRFMYPWNCKMCQYGELCQAELRNHDAEFLRSTQYTIREHR